MRLSFALALALTSVCTAAQTAEPAARTLRELTEGLTLQLVQLEAQACTAAHPARAVDWEPGVARFAGEVRKALDAQAARQPQVLAEPVPGVMFGHLDQMRELHRLEGTARDLDRCQRFGQEYANAPSGDIAKMVAEAVSSLSRTVAEFRKGMQTIAP